jgi:hypothetical protein
MLIATRTGKQATEEDTMDKGLVEVLTELLDHAEKCGGVSLTMSKTWNKARTLLGKEIDDEVYR